MITAFFPTRKVPVIDENQIAGIVLNYDHRIESNKVEVELSLWNKKRYIYYDVPVNEDPSKVILSQMESILKILIEFIDTNNRFKGWKSYYE